MRASIILIVNMTAALWLLVQLAFAGGMAQDDSIRLRVTQVLKANGGIEVSCEVKNLGKGDIWVFVGYGDGKGEQYGIEVDRARRSVALSLRAPSAGGGDLPVMARYKRLSPGYMMMFRLMLDETVRAWSPASGMMAGEIGAREIEEIGLSLGYFSVGLDSAAGCCSPAPRMGELIVNPGWEGAKEEGALSITVSRKMRWK